MDMGYSLGSTRQIYLDHSKGILCRNSFWHRNWTRYEILQVLDEKPDIGDLLHDAHGIDLLLYR